MNLSRRYASFIFLISFLLCPLAFAQIKPINSRIINGTPTNPKNIPVVLIIGRDSFGQYSCSGTMISQNIVLTARHCVSSTPSNHTVILKGRRYSVSGVRIHPLSKDTSSGPIYDVALLYLKTNPRSNFFPILTSRSVRAGEDIAIYGYGLTENNRSGRLNSGFMNVRNTNARWIVSEFDGSRSNTCVGDSGGPAFAIHKNRRGQSSLVLVGVTSGGEREDCMAGDVSYFVNLQSTATRNFLRRNVRSLSVR